MKNFSRYFTILFILSIFFTSSSLIFCSCKNSNIPKTIKLYNIETQQIEELKFNDYLAGVVEAEISANAPEEALKTQAVLARTFTINFLKNNKSKYKNADISNDITEAQAYKKSTSRKVASAVAETQNLILKCKNQYINPLFFANSGGKTANPSEGLNLIDENYQYIKSVNSPENNTNSSNYNWTTTISKNQILNATRNMGISLASVSTFKKGEIGESGRCKTFIIGGKEVNANTFRLNIGSTVLKSTLIDQIQVDSSTITFTGRGYGHGVGLSQEGAIILANKGLTFKDIIFYYFQDIVFKNE